MAFLSEIANKVVPLVNLHLVAQRLGVEAFGLSQYALWLLDWGIILTTFGFTQVAPVMLKNATSKDEQKGINGGVITARLILATMAIIALVIAIEFQNQLMPYKTAVLSSLFILIASALESTWILAAKQKLALLSVISIIAKLLSVVAIYSLVRAPEDAVTFVVITCLINAVIAVASFFVAVRLVGLKLPSMEEVINSLKSAAPFALAVILFWGVDRFDLYLVEKYFGAAATGLYSAASKLIGSITPIIAATSAVFYSEMLGQSDHDSLQKLVNASLFWTVSILAPIVFFLSLFSEAALSFVFGANFTEAAGVLLTLGLGTFFFAAIFIFGFQLLALKQKWRPLVFTMVFGAIVGLSCGYIAIANQNLSAVALAAVAAKVATGVAVSLVAVRVWKLSVSALGFGILRAFIPTVILATIVTVYSLVGLKFSSSVGELVLLIGLYAMIFCGLNLSEVKLVFNHAYRRLVGQYIR